MTDCIQRKYPVSTRAPTTPQTILTPQEIESVQFAQEVYGAEAKTALVEFTEALGVNPKDQARLVGAGVLRIESLDFEQRREMAAALKTVAGMLGGVAVPADIAKPQNVVTLIPATDPNNIGLSKTETLHEGTPPLSPLQSRWLSRITTPEAIDKLESLPVSARVEFATNLGADYQNLSVNRLTMESKRLRCQQLVMLMEGRSHIEIGEAAGKTPASIGMGLQTMAGTITRNIPQDVITGHIPKYNGDTPQTQEADRYTNEHLNWYKKIFRNPATIEKVMDLNATQRTYLTEQITQYIKDNLLQKERPTIATRKTQIVEFFVSGKSTEEIAKLIAMPIGPLKKELHEIAIRLKIPDRQYNIERSVRRAAALIEATDE